MKTLGWCVRLSLLLVPLCGTWAQETPLVALSGEQGVYVFWGRRGSEPRAYDVYRKQGAGAFEKVAQVKTITDPAEMERIFGKATGPASPIVRPQPDLHKLAAENPEADEGFAFLFPAYALVRGYAYWDENARAGASYAYRVMDASTGQSIGEVEARRALPRPSSSLRLETTDKNIPILHWSSPGVFNFNVLRASVPGGPFAKVTILALPGALREREFTFEDKHAPSDGKTCFYKVEFVDLLGRPAGESEVVSVVTKDLTAPEPPGELATSAFPGGVRLTWKANSGDDTAGYYLYRSQAKKDPAVPEKLQVTQRVRLNQTPVPQAASGYEDTTAVPGGMYFYEVTAVDANANESRFSPPTLASPKDLTPPKSPTGLSARALEGGKVVLTWDANTESDIAAYRIYQGINAGAPALFVRQVERGSGKTKMRFEQQLNPRSQNAFRFAVSAVDLTDNESALSESVRVRLPDHVPPLVPVITGLQSGDGHIEVTWDAVAEPDLAGFNLYRQENQVNPVKLNSQLLPTENRRFKDDRAKPDQVYLYSVSAVDRSGNESKASEVRSTSTFKSVKLKPPSALRIQVSPNAKKITLTWEGAANAPGFLVYASNERDGDYRQVGGVITARRLELSQPIQGWYRVQTISSDGHVSELSEPGQVEKMPPRIPQPAKKP